jgi:glycosyltransferase 2 family protein
MRWRLALIIAVTFACMAAVLSGIEWDRAREALAGTAWWTFGPVLICYLIAHGFRTSRLGALLGGNVPFGSLFAINSIGFLAINVVPLRLGEFVRPAMLVERHDVPFGVAMAAVVMERLLDMCMLLVMLLGLTFWVDLPQEGLIVRGIDVVGAGQRLAGGVVALGTIGGALLVWIGEPAILLLERMPAVGRFANFARRFREAIQTLIANPLRLLVVAFQTAALWGTTLLGIGVFMWGFPGIPSTIGAVWTTWSVTLAGMTALPTPGFFGGYELFCTAALWLLGVGPAVAGTFAITLHLGQFAFTCGLGGFFLAREGLGLSSLVVAREDITLN